MNVMKRKITAILMAITIGGLISDDGFAATTYLCNYTTYSDQEGNHKVEEKFELIFIVDKATGKSYMLGNNDVSFEVRLLESGNQLAFLEVTPSGSFMTTAIDRKLNSVHSRNTVMLGKVLPSQYYGKCEVKLRR